MVGWARNKGSGRGCHRQRGSWAAAQARTPYLLLLLLLLALLIFALQLAPPHHLVHNLRKGELAVEL